MSGILGDIIAGAGLGILSLAGLWIFMAFLRSFLVICQPNQVIVFAGRRRRLADGTTVGYTVLRYGRRVRMPIIETASTMDVSTMTVDVKVTNAYSKGNIPLSINAIANVKISTKPSSLNNAIERFLGRAPDEIRRVAKETIEGALRGVIAKLTPEQVNEDRMSFVKALTDEAEEDLSKIGLQIDILKIQSVTDSVNYLDSIGRSRIASVLRDAEVAESDNQREADNIIAEMMGRARVAKESAGANIQSKQNELRRIKAELESQFRSEEETTIAAAQEARARAEVSLQEIRRELEILRLQADEVLPAEAKRRAAEMLAQGESAAISAQGRATSKALELMSEAWRSAGPAAAEIFVIQQLEPLLARIASRVAAINVGRIRVVDGGDGGAVRQTAGVYLAMVESVLTQLAAITGVDIRAALAAPPAAANLTQAPDGATGA